MQTLNTLSTPEEKLAALCKKYAELVSAPPFYTLPALGGLHIFNYPKLHYVSSYGAECAHGRGAELRWERTRSKKVVKVCEEEAEGISVNNEKANMILRIILRSEMGNQGLLLYIGKRVAGGLVCGHRCPKSWVNVVVEALKSFESGVTAWRETGICWL